MNAHRIQILLITLLALQSSMSLAETTILLKDSSGQPANIGWFKCQTCDSGGHERDYSEVLKVLTQYGREAELRSDWLKVELEAEQKFLGLSPTNLISLFASLITLIVTVVATVAIARFQHVHNKRLQAKVNTLQIWDQYLERHRDFSMALDVLDKPAKTMQSGFLIVQGVRAWIDGIASLDKKNGFFDREILRVLTISGPLRRFMTKLEWAAKELEKSKAKGESSGIQWYDDYKLEVDQSDDIDAFLKKLEGN